MTEMVKEGTRMNPKIKERIELIRQGIVPEGYKKTRIGIIPEEWEVKALSDVCHVTMGQSPKSEFYNDEKEGLPLIQGNADIKNGKTFPKIYTTDITKRCFPNDIILSVRAPVGEVSWSVHEACIGRGVCSISTREGYDNKFLFYYLLDNEVKWEKYSQGSTFKAVNSRDIRAFPVLNIPLLEQQQIAEILSTWDRAIELKEALIKEKEEQKKGLMQKVFSKVEEYSYVGELIKESKEVEESPEVERLLTVRLHLEGVFKRSLRGNETVGSTTLYRREAGQFIYGKQNFHNGALGIVPEKLDGYSSSSDIPSFDFVTEKVVPLYFYYYWSQKVNYKRMEAFTTGTGSKRLNPKDFYNIKMRLPSIQEQHSIAKMLSMMDAKLNLLKKKLSLLKEQKKGLMQLLLTGIVRVGEVGKLE